jgi:hypothetical protein
MWINWTSLLTHVHGLLTEATAKFEILNMRLVALALAGIWEAVRG